MSLLITVEGPDGAGKSTLVERLQEAMLADIAFNERVHVTREPGSPLVPSAKDLRKMVLETPDFKPFERELLFYVDASLHQRFIAEQKDSMILSDRGLWSHLAYLRGYLKQGDMNYDDYAICKTIIDKVCAKPDCVVYLRGSVDLMRVRNAEKAKDLIEKQGDSFFSTVIETYEDLVTKREWNGEPLVILDACDTIDNNIMQVICYLKEVFHHDQLRSGNKEICGI